MSCKAGHTKPELKARLACLYDYVAAFWNSMSDPLSELFAVIVDRRENPQASSYTCKLFAGGDNKILKKIGEESAEVVMACKDDDPDAIAGEVADLFYHTLVAIAHHHVDLQLVYDKLAQRR